MYSSIGQGCHALIKTKFPVFSLSGKMDFQIPFSLCRGNPVGIFINHKK